MNDAPNGTPTVLQVLPRLEGSGGVERGAFDISRALSEAGWRSLIVTGSKADRTRARAAGARHATLPVGRRNPLAAASAIYRLAGFIAENGVDLVHARSRWPAWLAGFAARRARLPFVTTFHGTYATDGPLKRRYNTIMTRGDRVIAISDFIARHIAERYAVEADKVRVVPRGVDLSVFDPAQVAPPRIAALARAWSLPDGCPTVVLPARMTEWKGHLPLLEALARIDGDFLCLFVGGGGHEAYRDRIERRTGKLGLEGRIRLTGECRDMPAAYMLADVVVSASTRPEAFGRIAVEAQAMGRPVVATGHGGAQETVRDGETGWLVPPGDTKALGLAIRRALDLTAAERGALARTARAHVQRHFSLADMCEATLAVYRELLPAPVGGGPGGGETWT